MIYFLFNIHYNSKLLRFADRLLKVRNLCPNLLTAAVITSMKRMMPIQGQEDHTPGAGVGEDAVGAIVAVGEAATGARAGVGEGAAEA